MTSVRTRAILGLANLFVVLWLAIFLPAGSLDYREAWIYLAAFFIPSGLITFYFLRKDPDLIRNRLKAGPGAEKRLIQKLIQACASLLFVSIFLIAGYDHRFGLSSVPDVIVILADMLTVLSFTLIFFVFRENAYTSGTIEVSPKQPVVSSGPYAVVRHPMYSGALILLLVTPMALGSWWGLLLDVPMIILIILRLFDEEKFLLESLSAYSDYIQKVRYRLIPYIW